MLKKIAIGLLGVIVLLVLVIATRPPTFHVERSTNVAAAPALVFPLINDFHAWASWSPWEKRDPEMKREYSGAPNGKGAGYAWRGNDQVGSGNMQITESDAPSRILIRLEFKEPFQATNTAIFELMPDGPGTRVTWGMDGQHNFATKAMSLFADMDGMIGKDFEQGLAHLRLVSEAEAAKQRAASVQAAAAPNAAATAGAAPGAAAAAPH